MQNGLEIGVLKCDNSREEQVFMLTEANEIRKDKICVTFKNDGESDDLKHCNGMHTQKFAYNNQVSFEL